MATKRVPKQNPISESVLRNLFDAYDKDKSGALDPDELSAILSQLGSNLKMGHLDQDGDNRVTFEELKVLCECTGRHTHPIFKRALEAIAPASHSGVTNIAVAGQAHENEAFLNLAAKSWRVLSTLRNFDEAGIAAAFRRIDVDKDGVLTPKEIRRAIKELAPSLSEIDITLMLATSDRDSDGYVTFSEFKAMMLQGKDDDVAYWERYGKRDMHVALADRSEAHLK
ncbi:hypothetical protein AB1Y20_012706 [Prymnesium parvum]|uniref:EF-hand domain-containing protein n=1 Tax=Prymnesium parvum TaxID=97485 RepID=A0AB34IIN8_PRYPA|eukprot:CAMPEP_0182823098 /NCGR_PEP_ID=MMETSP0006_2-20121128/14563_1 /TAXON_ID=97485 /ORGANISM="Prymnesium parvum, Strain Texoma1" /LENGTH=225 /DNA_ID=CAMNT_0024949981 /DNA_START=11 /DNA_END=688 /DNA_ORIENTATION=+